LRVDLRPGEQHKVAVKLDIPAGEDGGRLDLSRAARLVVDVRNDHRGGFRAALLVTTIDEEGQWRSYESESVYLRPGWNRNLRLPLADARFKSAATDWQAYDTPLQHAGRTAKLTLLFYNADRIATTVVVDNLRLETR
jgi:hypothetical protein